MAPSWRGLQKLLGILEEASTAIGMTFNTKKTVCMIFNPCDKRKMVCSDFPQFVLAKCNLTFVSQFKYLGHIIEHSFSDDADISRELKSLFTRTNLLIRRFARCTSDVKVKLFRSFVLCFYDIALWNNFRQASLKKLASGYVKSLKLFLDFSNTAVSLRC